LDGYLAQQKQGYGDSSGSDGPWLVGNKFSYADFAFIPWQRMAGIFLDPGNYDEAKFPHVKEWLGKMTSRETVEAALKEGNM